MDSPFLSVFPQDVQLPRIHAEDDHRINLESKICQVAMEVSK
jgi:hypothetical protein